MYNKNEKVNGGSKEVILGIGSDLVDMRRIEKLCARFGKKFEKRIFTANEIATADNRGKAGTKAKASSLAKRFAAKEACAKALGTGISGGITWQDISISNHISGAPLLTLSGMAAKRLKKLTPSGMTAQINLTIADEYPTAQAFVVISAY